MHTTAIRAFIAVEIDETLRHKLGMLLREFQKNKCDVKWVKQENFHLTLVFLGDILSETVEQLKSTLQKAVSELQPFEIEIKGVETFGHPKHPRVIWAGVEPIHQIQQLYNVVSTELTILKLPIEEREYTPHLTIGRIRSTRGLKHLIDIIETYKTHIFGTSTVDSIVLMKSVLHSTGPVYSILKKIPFCKLQDTTI